MWIEVLPKHITLKMLMQNDDNNFASNYNVFFFGVALKILCSFTIFKNV